MTYLLGVLDEIARKCRLTRKSYRYKENSQSLDSKKRQNKMTKSKIQQEITKKSDELRRLVNEIDTYPEFNKAAEAIRLARRLLSVAYMICIDVYLEEKK